MAAFGPPGQTRVRQMLPVILALVMQAQTATQSMLKAQITAQETETRSAETQKDKKKSYIRLEELRDLYVYDGYDLRRADKDKWKVLTTPYLNQTQSFKLPPQILKLVPFLGRFSK